MAYSKNTDAGLIVPKKWYESLPRPSWNRFEKVETSQPWFSVYETTPRPTPSTRTASSRR